MLDNITYLKHKAILSTIYSSGLRVSEVINLRISDIMSKEMKIRVRVGKRNKERYTLLSKKNLLLLREYWKRFGYKNYSPEDYLFISRQTGKPLTNCCVESAIDKAVKKAGINRKATPHTLRHSFATHLMNDEVDLVTISVSETLIELAKDKKCINADIGFTSILHTWGQNLMNHPHIHCIVPGGGLSLDKSKWIKSKKKFFIPVKVLSRKFRGKFLYYMNELYLKNNLKFQSSISDLSSRDVFSQFKDSLYKK